MNKLNTILVLIILLIPFVLQSQWRTSSGSNKFDGNYKAATVIGSGGKYPYTKPTLVISKFDSSDPDIYLTNIGYTGCGKPSIEITFNNSDIIYTYESLSNRNNDKAFLSFSLSQTTIYYKSISLQDLMKKFKEKNKVYLRYANNCGADDFVFTLSGSTRAIDYVLGDYFKKLSKEEELNEENEKKDISERQSIIDNLSESFNCDTPLNIITTFRPIYNNMYISMLNTKLYKQNIRLGKSNEIHIYNRWNDKYILVKIEGNSMKNFYYASPSTLWKLTDNEIIKFLKYNDEELAKDCGTLTEDQLNML